MSSSDDRVKALADLSALILDYLTDEVDATFPGFHATALTSRIASGWMRDLLAEERAKALREAAHETLGMTYPTSADPDVWGAWLLEKSEKESAAECHCRGGSHGGFTCEGCR